jgi:hypothetical protein
MDVVDHDLARAIALYEWNMAVSSALFETLGAFEVVLRNAMHERLSVYYSRRYHNSGSWYSLAPLDADGRAAVDIAIDRATDKGMQPELPGKVVAELSFGFWRYLLSKKYRNTIWPAVKSAFPSHPDGQHLTQAAVREPVVQLYFLRNRIAHHEPIFRRDLAVDRSRIIETLSWICPDTSQWAANRCRVEAIIAQRPATTTM